MGENIEELLNKHYNNCFDGFVLVAGDNNDTDATLSETPAENATTVKVLELYVLLLLLTQYHLFTSSVLILSSSTYRNCATTLLF